MLVVAAIMVLRKNQMALTINELLSSRSLLMFAGSINLLFGLAIAIGHPIWELTWRGLITLIGYISVLKGVMRIAFPDQENEVGKILMQGMGYWIVCIVVVLIGAFLTYYGFGF